jgi:hypothetical protein
MAAPQVDIIARPVGVNLVPPPQPTPGLELAASLQGLNEALGPALQGYAQIEKAKLSAKAQADAMAQSGQPSRTPLGRARFRPTQNPWYVQAYEEKAAQVRAQGQISALASQSQTWAEKTDPKAFASRWAKEVGTIGQHYQGLDQAKGFRAAADPLSEQALNSNAEFNSAAIVQKHVQDTTQLMSQHLADAYRANPKGSSASFYAAIQPDLEQWKATGGTDAQVNELIRGAFSAAASNVGDGDFLDHLKYDRGGKGAIYNMVAPNGDPYSGDIEQTKYRIYRMQELQGMGEVHKPAGPARA